MALAEIAILLALQHNGTLIQLAKTVQVIVSVGDMEPRVQAVTQAVYSTRPTIAIAILRSIALK